KPSTFTKLQALSATGRSLTAPAGSGLEAEGLKSILDRLEDQAETAREPSPVNQPVKAQAAPIETSPSPAAKVAHPPPAEPSLGQPAPPKGSSIASRLVGVVTKNKMPAAQKPAFKFDPEPQAKVEAETPPVIEPETTSTAEAPVDQPFAPDVGQEVAALAASETGETASSRSNIFESPVDDEMDQLFSKLAP